MSWSDDDLDFALRDLKDAELPLGATAAVRARVLAEVSKSARRSRWVWALAPWQPRRWCCWRWSPSTQSRSPRRPCWPRLRRHRG